MSAWMTRISFGLLLLLIGLNNVGCRYLTDPMQIFSPDPDDGPELARYGKTIEQRAQEAKNARDKMSSASAETRSQLVQRLVIQIRNEQSPEVRVALLDAMGASKTQQGMNMLQAAKKDPDKFVRMKVCHVWAEVGTPQATKELTEILKSDTDIDVQMAAAEGLGEFKSQENVQALASGLADNNIAVQEVVMESLRENTGRSFKKDVRKWDEYVKTGKVTAEKEESVVNRFFPFFR